MTLHVSSTVVLIIRRSKLYYTASGIVTLCRLPSGAQVGRGVNVYRVFPWSKVRPGRAADHSPRSIAVVMEE